MRFKSKSSSNLLSAALPLILGAQFFAGDAFARPEYLAPAALAGVDITNGCATCHVSAAGGGRLISNSCISSWNSTRNYAALATCLSSTTVTPPVTPPVVTPPVTPPVVPPVTNTDSESDDDDDATPRTTPAPAPAPSAVPLTVNGKVGRTTSTNAATNVYDVTCGTGTQSLSAAVIDLAPVLSPIVSIQLTKGTTATAIASDSIDGDAIYSNWVKLSQGQGHYNLLISKSKVSAVKGAELYTAKFYCLDAKGKRTATQAKIKQSN